MPDLEQRGAPRELGFPRCAPGSALVLEALFCTRNDIVLNSFIKRSEEGTVACNPNNKASVPLGVSLGVEQRVLAHYVELDMKPFLVKESPYKGS